MKDRLKIIFFSIFSAFVLMFSYESTKELIFKGTLTPWQSHWITIIFTTTVSLFVVLFVMNRLLFLERQSMVNKLREEKLKSIKQVMRVVHHHVNNLANNLNLVEFEVKQEGSVCGETLDTLNKAIKESAEAMKLLGDMDNPYDDEMFKID